jgi:hypothetical protein
VTDVLLWALKTQVTVRIAQQVERAAIRGLPTTLARLLPCNQHLAEPGGPASGSLIRSERSFDMHAIGIGMVLLGLLYGAQGDAIGKVETSFDKKTNFAALRTYTWTVGYNAYVPEAHKMIVAAFEAEMTRLGFTKVETGADVTLTYATVTGTDVDLKALDKLEREGKSGATPTKARARLMVIMRTATSSAQIWAASTREYLDPDPANLGATIQSVTARLFATYPGAKPARPNVSAPVSRRGGPSSSERDS